MGSFKYKPRFPSNVAVLFGRPLAIFFLDESHYLDTGLAREACVPRDEEDGGRGRKRDAERGIITGKPPQSSFFSPWSSWRDAPLDKFPSASW